MIERFGKTTLLAMVVAGLLFSTNASAAKRMIEIEDSTPEPKYENMLTTNIWPWLGGFFNLGYERALSDSFSLRPRAFYWSFSSSGNWALYGFALDAYFHPMGNSLAGWFLGPRFDTWMLSVTENGSSGTGVAYLVGGMAGYKWVYKGNFSFGIALGAQTILGTSVTTSSGTQTFDFPYKGFLPAFDAEFSWAF